MEYKIIIFKSLHLIPEIFTIESPLDKQTVTDKIYMLLDGNAIVFTDTKGKVRMYDRGIISKIFIKAI